MDARDLRDATSRRGVAKVLRRLAWALLCVPTALLALGLLPQLLPWCHPQMYGVGECLVGNLNLAPFILIAIAFGLPGLILTLAVAFLPLRALAWWLERGTRSA
jgi:hypothetical protein